MSQAGVRHEEASRKVLEKRRAKGGMERRDTVQSLGTPNPVEVCRCRKVRVPGKSSRRELQTTNR